MPLTKDQDEKRKRSESDDCLGRRESSHRVVCLSISTNVP